MLGSEPGEVLLVSVLVLQSCGVVGDRLFHHPRHNIDRSPLLHGLSLQFGGVAECGVEEVPVDQVPLSDELGECGLEDLLQLIVAQDWNSLRVWGAVFLFALPDPGLVRVGRMAGFGSVGPAAVGADDGAGEGVIASASGWAECWAGNDQNLWMVLGGGDVKECTFPGMI